MGFQLILQYSTVVADSDVQEVFGDIPIYCQTITAVNAAKKDIRIDSYQQN
jgi:hypothetical protein